MLRAFLIRKILAFALSAGVFLLGAVPSWAASMGGPENMPNMTMVVIQGGAMNCDCSHMMGKGMPKQSPCRNCALCYAVCTAFAANSGMISAFSFAAVPRNGGRGQFAAGALFDGLTHPPALPPPILHA